jgi:hypothetical protein
VGPLDQYMRTDLRHFISSEVDFDFLKLLLSVPRLSYWCYSQLQVKVERGFSSIKKGWRVG